MDDSPIEGETSFLLAPQACKRCSINKKKCDRLIPRCTGCVQADVPCEAPIKPADRRLQRQVNELRSEAIELKKQVAHLRTQLRMRDMAPRANVEVQSGETEHPSSLRLPFLAINDHHGLFRQSHSQSRSSYVLAAFGPQGSSFGSFSNPVIGSTSDTGHPTSTAHASEFNELPSLEEVRITIKSLFESAKHGPSNVDKIIDQSQLEDDCRTVYGTGGLSSSQYADSRFRCFMTAYLAMCMIAAANGDDVSADPRAVACRFAGMRELASVTAKEDITCVEALTLLCEVAIHDSGGPSLWQLVGLASRTAIASGLHRRDDVFLPLIYPSWPAVSDSPEVVAARNQRRKDLFWALYSLDRLTMVVLNRPASIRDEDIDVDIHGALYGGSKTGGGELQDPEQVVGRYVHHVQQWYMLSRFNATVVPFSDDTVKRLVLDDVQYHQMIMALHQPSPLVTNIPSNFVATLKRSASLSVNLFHHATSRKQLNIHWINLYHFYTSCAVLVYCFREYILRPDLVRVPEDEIAGMFSRCRETISLFRGTGQVVHRVKDMLERLLSAFESQPPTTSPRAGTSLIISPPSQVVSLNHPDVTGTSGFDIDMLFNGMLQDACIPDTLPATSFLEGGFTSDLASFMLPSTWTEPDPTETSWNPTVNLETQVNTDEHVS